MGILYNYENSGVGRPSNIASGLRAIQALLGEPAGSHPPPADSVDYSPMSKVKALPTLIANAVALQSQLGKTVLEEQEPLISLGGCCGSELAPIAWLNTRLGGRLQMVWFDAHADLNTPETSPSGAFHGMVLRTLCGDGPSEMAEVVPRPLLPSQVLLAGVREFDFEEERYLAASGIRQLSARAINASPKTVAEALDPDIAVYLHVDYDVLDGDLYPESSYPVPLGLSLDSLISAMASIREFRTIAGMSLTEFAPATAGAGANTVKRLLTEGFGLSLRTEQT